jgi:CDP-diacylglycerol--serine O-phosphatidyltransferase
MRVSPRFVGRLGLADVITVANAALGFVAAAVATSNPTLAARLILLAAIADGLDGVVARKRGSTPAGEYLDSLADVASFAVAPAVFVFAIARADFVAGGSLPGGSVAFSLAVLAAFVAMAVVRLGLYTVYDLGDDHTEGVQTTLAATLLATIHLAGVSAFLPMSEGKLLLVVAALFVYMMVASIPYPELYARDALLLGALQALALLFPTFGDGVFARALLLFALAYLLLSPRFYWRSTGPGGETVRERDGAGE